MSYYLDHDNKGNWFVVPSDKDEEWEEWLALDSDDQRGWVIPEWAQAVGRYPSVVTFENPEVP